MNKYYFFCILLFLMVKPGAFAQVDTIRLNTGSKVKKQYYKQPLLLKSNPMAVLWGPIPFTAEYRIVAEVTSGRKRSAQLGISYLGKSLLWKMVEDATKTPARYQFKINGWRLQAGYRLYLNGKSRYAPFGFYVSPTVSYSNARISIGLNNYYKQVYYDFRHFNANLLMGVQLGRKADITMDIFTGIGYKENRVFYHANNTHIIPYDTEEFGAFYNGPIKLVFGINFGYAIY